jgi:hypothetical protein
MFRDQSDSEKKQFIGRLQRSDPGQQLSMKEEKMNEKKEEKRKKRPLSV